jgi:hypothetical protein
MKHQGVVSLLVVALCTSLAARAGDPCGAVMCLTQNATAPHACKDHVQGYFDIRVYDDGHRYNPAATAAKRYREVMNRCEGATQSNKERISAKYGSLEHSPFSFQ